MAAPVRGILPSSFRICSFCSKIYSPTLKKSFSSMKSKINEKVNTWKPVIGLEIHAQIQAKTKLFSGAGTKYAAPTNTQVSFFDAALPGTLPVINKKCVEAAVKTGFALKCKINRVSKFDRKHYFYADLPAGYQITQQRQPIAADGYLEYVIYKQHTKQLPRFKTARITRIQIEQDSGKSLHDVEGKKSLIDLNRAGVGLMEIVTEPDFNSADEAVSFVRDLQHLLMAIGTCDGKMNEGSLRVDANISVHAPGEPIKGFRVEVKNINSARFVSRAIDYEIKRQIALRESGHDITRETRSYDSQSGKTVPMRDKESLIDYRFMPEPNLPPLRLYDSRTVPPTESHVNLDKLCLLPLLPGQMREELVEKYGVPLHSSCDIVNDGMYEYFLKVLENPHVQPGTAASAVMTPMLMLLRRDDLSGQQCPVSPSIVADLSLLVQHERVSESIKERLLNMAYRGDLDPPSKIVEKNNWEKITNHVILEAKCRKLMDENPEAVTKYRKGKKRILDFFIGGIHKATDRRADDKLVRDVVKQMLN